MILKQVLDNINYKLVKGNIEIDINDISIDSRKINKNDVFVALKGYNVDSHKYVDSAIKNGATTVVISEDIQIDSDITVIKVEDTRQALAYLSRNYFNKPDEKLITIGITGTKGKTTTTFMIRDILKKAGKKVGIIGTNGVYYDNTKITIDNTTPESYDVYKYLNQMVDNDQEYVVMEVSSQALKFNRVDGIIFDYGLFSNLTHDHIGDAEHPNMEDYIQSKAKLFQKCRHGIFNIDDNNFEAMTENATCDIKTFGYNKDADLCIEKVNLTRSINSIGISLQLSGEIEDKIKVNTPGIFSAYNATLAILLTHLLGVDISIIKEVLAKFHVEGRVETVHLIDNVTFIIDYAHNGVSAESILTTMRQYHPKRLIALFGCGGNRSHDRRYEMGLVAGTYADLSIITSDNPRFEDPNEIIKDIVSSISKTNGKYVTFADRKEAIRYAVENAMEEDIILILGKGHEDYQIIGDVKYHFKDREVLEEIVNEIKNKN